MQQLFRTQILMWENASKSNRHSVDVVFYRDTLYNRAVRIVGNAIILFALPIAVIWRWLAVNRMGPIAVGCTTNT
jgi:hypothetical protein